VFLDRHRPPYKSAGAVFLVIIAVVAAFIYLQFRGDLSRKTELTLLSPRAGLVVEPGSKVTYNGVQIGRVSRIEAVDEHGSEMAKLTLDVTPRYLKYIPANVTAEIRASTVFGNKYVSFFSPKDPLPQRISSDHRIQHLVRNGHVDRPTGRSHQAEPDAGGDGRGTQRARRPVRRVAAARRPDPR
jgi:phospholipid/cholesterol/gamma-HCH transport system substrate-binding protein